MDIFEVILGGIGIGFNYFIRVFGYRYRKDMEGIGERELVRGGERGYNFSFNVFKSGGRAVFFCL